MADVVERLAAELIEHFGSSTRTIFTAREAGRQAANIIRARLSQAGAGGVVVKTDMVNAAWNEAKTRRMTGLPTDFRAVLEAALAASARAGEPTCWTSEVSLRMAAEGVPAVIHAYPPPVEPVALYRTPPAPVQTANVEAVAFQAGLDAAAEYLLACDDYGDRMKADEIRKLALPASLTAPTQGDGQ